MFCYKCGTEIADESVYCRKCGAKVADKNTDVKMMDIAAVEKNPQNDAALDMLHNNVYKANENKFGDNIKPYYREQFERIASGQKPKFNWAALFLNGWIQLYNGCTGIFCKTFLPLLITMFLTSLIALLGTAKLNLTMISISLILGVIVGNCSLVLCIMNGLHFNKWYYQDIINNPGKKRSKKGFWVLAAVEMTAIVTLLLTPKLLASFYSDSAKEADVEEVSEEDLFSIWGEDSTAPGLSESGKPVNVDEAEEMISQWLSSHPIYPGCQVGFSLSFDKEKADNNGNDSWKFEIWVDGEEQDIILVNKDDGDIIIQYSIWNAEDMTFTQGQMPIDQWYTDIYLGEIEQGVNAGKYEKTARQIMLEWFERHPLMHNIRIQFVNRTVDAEDGSGTYLIYEMYMGNEQYGIIYVNPDSGDMIIDPVDDAGEPLLLQVSLEQWYLEYYWGFTESSGCYSELYEDSIYILYDGMGYEMLEYYADFDTFAICNYDLNHFIEYDDGSAASEVSITDFIGTFAYDSSFEAEGMTVNFYYQLDVGDWDGYFFSIVETWRGNTYLQDEWARPISLINDTLTFEIYIPDNPGYETHSLKYVPARDTSIGKDMIYIDGDDTMPFIRE